VAVLRACDVSAGYWILRTLTRGSVAFAISYSNYTFKLVVSFEKLFRTIPFYIELIVDTILTDSFLCSIAVSLIRLIATPRKMSPTLAPDIWIR
jgi:hypothetical protein